MTHCWHCVFIIHATLLNIHFSFSWGKVSNHLCNSATITRRLTRKDWTIWLLSLAAVTPLPRGVPPCFQWIPVWKQLNSYMICMSCSHSGLLDPFPSSRSKLYWLRWPDIKKLGKLIDWSIDWLWFLHDSSLIRTKVRAHGNPRIREYTNFFVCKIK